MEVLILGIFSFLAYSKEGEFDRANTSFIHQEVIREANCQEEEESDENGFLPGKITAQDNLNSLGFHESKC